MRTTYALLDDDQVFTTWLNHLIHKLHPLLEHAGSFSETVDAARAVTRLKPDILFLDMQIDCFNGLEFLEVLDYKPVTIVVSGSDNYKKRAARLGALDYLVKPVSEEALQAAVGRALWLIRSERDRQEIKLRQSQRRF
ncbi:MAG: response regulator [Bacteroidota bacterium]